MFNIEKKNMIIYFEYAKLCALRAYLLYVPLLLSLLLSFFLSYLTCLVPDMAEVRHALRDLVSYALMLYLMWPLCLVPYMFHVLLSSLILLCSLVSKCFFFYSFSTCDYFLRICYCWKKYRMYIYLFNLL